MALTNAQIDAILSINSTASLISGACVITDNSNFASIGVATPDTVKILLWIQDSTGITFYKNTGYDAASFASPDLQPLTSPTTYSFTLPTTTSGAYLQGQYTVNYKVQVVQGSNTNETYKALYMNVCGCCNGIEADVRGEVSYQTAVVSVTDYTNYKTWTSLANTLYLYPPTNTGAAQHATFHGSPATLTYVPASGFPYTGMWQWTLSSNITYTDPLTQTSTTCQLTSQGSFEVVQSQLCKVRCLLDKYRTEFYAKISVKSDPMFERNWNLASDDYMMAFMSERCGLPQTTIDKYIQNIYKITGIDPDCDCGCDDGTNQPLTPTSIINGTDGTDGSQILYGSGVPSGGTGVVGDTYINTANGSVYKKTGSSTWTFQFTISGVAGADGVAVLHNDITNSATAGTSLEILKTYTIPANQLSTDGSYLKVSARFSTSTATTSSSTKAVGVYFNGTAVGTFTFVSSNINVYEFDVFINRYSNTVVKTKSGEVAVYATLTFVAAGIVRGFVSNSGLNLTTTTYDITARANSDVAGDLTCENLTVTYYKK